jgi:hypothetical protein
LSEALQHVLDPRVDPEVRVGGKGGEREKERAKEGLLPRPCARAHTHTHTPGVGLRDGGASRDGFAGVWLFSPGTPKALNPKP